MEYFFHRNFGGYIYSVDMLRIRAYISPNEAKKVRRFLYERQLKFWLGKGYGNFSENWQVDKLWLGLGTLDTNNLSTINFTLEVNPNKATDQDWFYFYYFLRKYSFNIIRFDLSIDIPRNINQILFINLHKKNYSLFFHSYNDKTYYFGKGDGHTKIYNKKIESELDYELTRYEVTKTLDFPINNYKKSKCFVNFNFLEIAFMPYQCTCGDRSYDAMLYAVNNGYPYKDLTRSYKDRIKKDYFGAYELNNEYANVALNDFIKYLMERVM